MTHKREGQQQRHEKRKKEEKGGLHENEERDLRSSLCPSRSVPVASSTHSDSHREGEQTNTITISIDRMETVALHTNVCERFWIWYRPYLFEECVTNVMSRISQVLIPWKHV